MTRASPRVVGRRVISLGFVCRGRRSSVAGLWGRVVRRDCFVMMSRMMGVIRRMGGRIVGGFAFRGGWVEGRGGGV